MVMGGQFLSSFVGKAAYGLGQVELAAIPKTPQISWMQAALTVVAAFHNTAAKALDGDGVHWANPGVRSCYGFARLR